jgi:hypothetical protein
MSLSFHTYSMVPNGWVFVKFHIRYFHKSLSKNSTFGQNFTKILGTLRKDLSIFHTVGAVIPRTHSCAFLATLPIFIILFTATYAKIQREHSVALPWQERLCKCTRKLHYTYNSYLVNLGTRCSRDLVTCKKRSCPCICTWHLSTRWK